MKVAPTKIKLHWFWVGCKSIKNQMVPVVALVTDSKLADVPEYADVMQMPGTLASDDWLLAQKFVYADQGCR